MPADLLARYFEQVNGRYIFHKDLRRAVIFGRNDLVKDAPISRVDLLVCRDTLMYLNPETQRNMLGRLHFALGPQGTLFLGHAEMLLNQSERFTPLNLKDPIFRKAIGSHTGVERYNPTAACPTHLPMPAEPPSQLPEEALSSPLLKCPPVGRLRHRQSDLFRNACSGKQTKSSRLRV